MSKLAEDNSTSKIKLELGGVGDSVSTVRGASDPACKRSDTAGSDGRHSVLLDSGMA